MEAVKISELNKFKMADNLKQGIRILTQSQRLLNKYKCCTI